MAYTVGYIATKTLDKDYYERREIERVAKVFVDSKEEVKAKIEAYTGMTVTKIYDVEDETVYNEVIK